MKRPQVSPYGAWKSPISPESLASSSVGLGQVAIDGDVSYYLETRPSESGRSALVRRDADGNVVDATPSGYNVRSRAHEYGGGAFAVHDSVVYFVNFGDQRLYRQTRDSEPVALTGAGRDRWADLTVDSRRDRLVCVRERHADDGAEPQNSIASVDAGGGGAITTIVEGNDFYASPRISPDGQQICWIAWDHPNMPWDSTTLWLADVDAYGGVAKGRPIAGGDGVSVTEPRWSPYGALHYVSDATGWWNLYRWDGRDSQNLCPMQAEFSGPHWQFGMSHYGFTDHGDIVCCYVMEGEWRVARLSAETLELSPYDLPYTDLARGAFAVSGSRALFIAASPTQSKSVVQLDVDSGAAEIVRRSTLEIPPQYCSLPHAAEFPTGDGEGAARAFYYAPQNADYEPPQGEKPPLIVISHGGPTGATTAAYDAETQFWTTRGFAVLDVNYRGSVGYGTAYRRKLDGRWGVADVEDSVAGARWASTTGRADERRLIVRGSSAGGFTTLACLAFTDVFAAGASYYGIGDLETLATDTHKFESRYLDSLVGPYPEARDTYRRRSPINHVERLSCPVILLQGLDDEIVPPSQAEAMFDALRARGVPVAYVPFEGEGHGFRSEANIRAAIEAELSFYAHVFGFQLPHPVQSAHIHNPIQREP